MSCISLCLLSLPCGVFLVCLFVLMNTNLLLFNVWLLVWLKVLVAGVSTNSYFGTKRGSILGLCLSLRLENLVGCLLNTCWDSDHRWGYSHLVLGIQEKQAVLWVGWGWCGASWVSFLLWCVGDWLFLLGVSIIIYVGIIRWSSSVSNVGISGGGVS